MSAVGPWQEPMVDVVVRDHMVNDSALPQFETMQMRYCKTLGSYRRKAMDKRNGGVHELDIAEFSLPQRRENPTHK